MTRKSDRVQAAMEAAVTVDDDSGPSASPYDVATLNREYALVLMGSKAVIVREQPGGPTEDRLRILTVEAFRTKFLNRTVERRGIDGKRRQVTFANAWLGDAARRGYDGIEFLPGTDAKSSPGYLNLWRGFSVEPRAGAGSYHVFKDHLVNNVCAGRDELFRWVFGWFAHVVQRPRERPGTSLVFRGKMGTGKSKIGEVFGSLIRAHYYMVDDPRYIVGQFNAHMASCLLLQAEEAVWAGDKAAEGRLKGLVTSTFQMIEAKGVDPIRLDNYVRLIMTSNEDWVVPAGKDERRFCVLDIDPRCAQNHDYFREMDTELNAGGREALLHDLLNFDLSAVNVWAIPHTAALLEQKLRSLDTIDSWWIERLASGHITRSSDAWPEVVVSDSLYDDYIAVSERVGVRRKQEMTAFGIRMRKLVPGLVRKRITIDAGMGVARRAWGYELPSLDDCRGMVEEAMGQSIAWDTL